MDSKKQKILVSGLLGIFVGVAIFAFLGNQDSPSIGWMTLWCGIWSASVWLWPGKDPVADWLKSHFPQIKYTILATCTIVVVALGIAPTKKWMEQRIEDREIAKRRVELVSDELAGQLQASLSISTAEQRPQIIYLLEKHRDQRAKRLALFFSDRKSHGLRPPELAEFRKAMDGVIEPENFEFIACNTLFFDAENGTKSGTPINYDDLKKSYALDLDRPNLTDEELFANINELFILRSEINRKAGEASSAKRPLLASWNDFLIEGRKSPAWSVKKESQYFEAWKSAYELRAQAKMPDR